jgi:hypothetical protein
MDYIETVRRAFKIALKNKFLWIFGILIGGSASVTGFNLNSPSYQTGSADMEKYIESISPDQIVAFFDKYALLILSLMLFFLLLSVLFFILNVISQGALVASVARISKGESVNFKSAFSIGAHNFFRIWGVSILYFLMILASILVLVIPIIALSIGHLYALAIIWGILIFFVCLAFWILISLIAPYSLQVVVLKKLDIWESIRDSLHFFRKNWTSVVIMYLLLMAIGIGFSLAVGLAAILVFAILFAIGYAIWLASIIAAIAYAIMASIFILAALIIIGGAYKTFCSAAITLTYEQLR